MSAGGYDTLKVCHECGAENLHLALRCWMCHADLKRVPQVVIAEIVPDPPKYAPSEIFWMVLTALVGVLLVLVGIGLASEGPEPLIPYAIVIVPAFIATVVRVARKQSRGVRIGWGERLLTFLISGMAVIGFIGLLIVAALTAMFVYCLISLK